MAKILTIPKNLTKKGDLVVIPRTQYEEYLRLKKLVPIMKPSKLEQKAIQEGRREIKKGKYLTLHQLKNELEG